MGASLNAAKRPQAVGTWSVLRMKSLCWQRNCRCGSRQLHIRKAIIARQLLFIKGFTTPFAVLASCTFADDRRPVLSHASKRVLPVKSSNRAQERGSSSIWNELSWYFNSTIDASAKLVPDAAESKVHLWRLRQQLYRN